MKFCFELVCTECVYQNLRCLVLRLHLKIERKKHKHEMFESIAYIVYMVYLVGCSVVHVS